MKNTNEMKKLKKKRFLSYLLLTTMTISLFAGCGSKDTDSNAADTSTRGQIETNMQDVTDNDIAIELEDTTEISTEVEMTEMESTEIETDATEVETDAAEGADETQQEGAEQQTAYTYTEMNATMYAKQPVNVRNLPCKDGDRVGSLAKAQSIHVTGKCKETGWFRVDYKGTTAFVSAGYLLVEPPVTDTSATPNVSITPESSTTPGTSTTPENSTTPETSTTPGTSVTPESPTTPETPSESETPSDTLTEEDYIKQFYAKYGGSWDCEGTYVLGGYTGRSLYVNDVYNTSFKISTDTLGASDRAICDWNDSTRDDGIVGECVDNGNIWLASAGNIDLYLYTPNNTVWSVESEESFINSYTEWYKKGWANSYDSITFSESSTMNIGGNTYSCVSHEDMWSTNVGDLYRNVTMLVRKCDDGVLVYWLDGAVTEDDIREHILY